MRRIAVTFLTLLLLWTLTTQLSDLLSGLHVYLFAGGLFVAYAALMLPLRDGLVASSLGGLLHDSASPGYFGTSLILFGTAHVIVYHLRDRMPREQTAVRVLVALFANLGIFLLFSLIQIRHAPVPSATWPRLGGDLLCSQIFVVLVAPWFFALQTRALVLVGVERDSLAPPP